MLTVGYWQYEMQRYKEALYAEKIERAAKRAEEASEAKTRFLFNMSHDIRTPMNAIIGFSDLLEKHLDDKEKVHDYIKKIQLSGSFLLSLINYVLEMARIESGKATLRTEVGDAQELLGALNAVFEPAVEKKRLKYNCTLDVEHRFIICDINDKMRPFRNGSGSYDMIVPKFQKFAESRGQKNYYVRGTFTRNNLDFADDVIHYADLGFQQMSMEPVVADPAEDYAIREEDIPQILKEYDKLALEYIKRKKEGRGFNFFHFMLDLTAGPCVAKRLAGCGSGTEYLAVTPWGDLYPCHQFVGNEKFLLGNVDTGIVNTETRDEFKLCNVYAKETCKDCFARFYCSGGCSANAYNFSGSINGAYEIGCEMQKKRIECAIMIKAALADEEA